MSVEKIGRYQIDGELGKGAMGVVYKAVDPTIGRTVALKTMRLDVQGLENEEMLRRFKNEARAAGVLNHPNIVTIYDAGEAEGLFYIAMEFIEGQTLAAIINQHRVLPVEQIIRYTRQICSGLDFAHSKSIVHRDVKPANIMVAPDGTAKIMDFGIAKLGGNMTATGTVLGTPSYMSPEQVRGRVLDGRTDLFSLGVMVYEMLTGEKPFAGQNVTTIIYKIVNETPIPPRELDVSIHPGLSAVVTRALAKSPDERFASGTEFADALENYKSFGTDANATQALATSDLTLPGERTLVGSATLSGAAAAAAPARIPEPTARTTSSTGTVALKQSPAVSPQGGPKNRSKLPSVIVIGALVAFAIFGIVRFLLKPHNDAADLAKAQQAMQVASQATDAAQKLQPQATYSAGAPATATGELRVTSTPSGAKVEIDGQSNPAWVTPFTAEKLPTGKHTLTFSLENYKAEKKTVEVASGIKVFADATLVSPQGTVKLSSDPQGALVFIDNKPTQQVTPTQLTLTPGEHTFTLRLAGYDESGDLLTVSAGQTVTLSPKLTPRQGANPLGKIGRFFKGADTERGMLKISTEPNGAHVLINGRVAGETPIELPVKAGEYKIIIGMEGYRFLRRQVTVVKGNSVEVNERLVPKRQ